MFAATLRSKIPAQRLTTRNFQSSSRSMNKIFGTPQEGVYSNIPFKVKNRKIPLAVPWWGVIGFFFGFPFAAAYLHLRKAGSFDQ